MQRVGRFYLNPLGGVGSDFVYAKFSGMYVIIRPSCCVMILLASSLTTKIASLQLKQIVVFFKCSVCVFKLNSLRDLRSSLIIELQEIHQSTACN